MSSYYYESCKQKKTIITIHSSLKQQTKKHQSTVIEFTQQTYKGTFCAVNKALFSPVVLSHYTLSVFGCALVTLVLKVLDNLLLCLYYILPGTLVGQGHHNTPKLVTQALYVIFNLTHFYGDRELMRNIGCNLRRRVTIARDKTSCYVYCPLYCR